MSFRQRNIDVHAPPQAEREVQIPQRLLSRQQIGPFTYAANSASAGFQNLLTFYCGSDVGASAFAYGRYYAPYSGYIVGMSVTEDRNGSNLGTPVSFQAFVNGTGVNAYMTLPLQASQTATFRTDDALAFNAGDQLEVVFSGSTSTATIASPYTILFWLTVEM